jgi:hypothetical protein
LLLLSSSAIIKRGREAHEFTYELVYRLDKMDLITRYLSVRQSDYKHPFRLDMTYVTLNKKRLTASLSPSTPAGQAPSKKRVCQPNS